MLVKQRLRIQAVIVVTTAAVILLALSLALYRVNRTLEEDGIAEELAIGAFERNAFRSDYLRNNNERARVQWFAKHEQIGKFLQLAREKFQDVEGKKAVAALIKDHESSGKIFSDLVANREKKGGDAASAALVQETENRLANQLEMRLYQRIFLARTLRDVARSHLVSAFRLTGWVIFGVLIILIAAVLINSWAMGRTIADRIGRLRDGAAVIGAGDLDYRIAIPGDDELAQLSGAFDAMTAKLGLSYHNLEKEVEERKRAEEALRQSRDGLELRVRERTQELEAANASVREINETLEQRVAERTAALQVANASLRDSRRAALNLMEDAVIARGEAESSNAELRREAAERKRGEEIIRRGNTLLQGINRIFKEALKCETDEELARACLRVAEEITGSLFGFIDEIGPDGLLHEIAISDPGREACTMYDKTEHRRRGVFKLHGIYGRVFLDGKSFFTNDPASHPDSIGTPEGHPPLHAFLGVPLFQGGRTIGLIALGNREGGYSREEQEEIETLAPAIVEALYRVRAEQSLRESEQQLNKAQDISHLGSWELDLVRNTLTWSDEVYRIFGFQPQEFGATYEAFLEAVHPDDRAAVDAAYSGSLREGRDTYEIEHRVVRKATGEVRIIREKCEHLRDEAGRIVRSVGMVHDITDRKRVEEEREIGAGFLRLVNESKSQEDLVRSAVSYLQEHSGCEAVGIRLKEGDDYPYFEVRGFPEQFVLMENSLCARDDAGLPLRESAGDPIMECMCGNVIQGRFDPAQPFFSARGSFWTNCTTELLATTTEADRQARTRNRCNGEGYESVALIAIRAGAEPLGLLQLNDRRPDRFSPERIALWERLAGYLGIALEKFRAEKSLEHSVAELAAANKDLESFIYSVSHDLQGPLRSVAFFTKMIARDCADRLDERDKDYFHRIEKASSKMNRIIVDLLHLSRISRYEIVSSEVDLSPMAQTILMGLRESSPGRDVEVNIPEGLTVRCDPRLIEFALSNLLGNAWKFTSKTARGRIAFGALAQEGKTVYYVKDNGAGFDPEHVGKMFLPFHRLHGEDEFEGTGIGLAIVELVIRRHGGKVWAEGEVGKGATVFFTLA